MEDKVGDQFITKKNMIQRLGTHNKVAEFKFSMGNWGGGVSEAK